MLCALTWLSTSVDVTCSSGYFAHDVRRRTFRNRSGGTLSGGEGGGAGAATWCLNESTLGLDLAKSGSFVRRTASQTPVMSRATFEPGSGRSSLSDSIVVGKTMIVRKTDKELRRSVLRRRWTDTGPTYTYGYRPAPDHASCVHASISRTSGWSIVIRGTWRTV
jgi:hypothetical protein